MVSLVIDAREACRPQRTGKGQWTHGCIDELLRRGLALTLLTDGDVPPAWEDKATVERVPGSGLAWHWNVLRWLKKQPGSITYLSPVSYIVPAFAPKNVAVIPVIHDLIAFRHEPHDRKATLIERWTMPRMIRKAAHLCTISESTKRDLLERYPHLDAKSVTPIFAGPMHLHPERNAPDHRTILCIGTLCPRKNQLRLIHAFAALPDAIRQSHRLMLAGGRGWHDDEIVAAAKSTPGVEWLGYIDDSEYESLMHTCAVFALPSLYEGFGMQILDALQRGIPVLTSNRGSLREVAEGAAAIVNPESVESIAEGLQSLLANAPLRAELREKGIQRAAVYSWRRTVDVLLGIIDH